MPQPKIICKYCGDIFAIGGVDFPDLESLEESDLVDVRSFCSWCEKENTWNKDDIVNTLEFPLKQLVVRQETGSTDEVGFRGVL